jgi:putative hydrolase of the HAD superfamily
MATTGGQSIDLLILDVDDVLYRYDRTQRVEQLAAATGTTPDAVWLAVFESGLEDRADAGELDADEYLRAVSQRLGRELDRRTWTRARARSVTPMAPTFELVRTLDGTVDVVGLSNNGHLVKEESATIFPELAPAGIELHVSAEFGARKPAEVVYRRACELLRVDPDRAAFVDDDPANADGATAAGLHGHHFTTVESLAAFLRPLGLPT